MNFSVVLSFSIVVVIVIICQLVSHQYGKTHECSFTLSTVFSDVHLQHALINLLTLVNHNHVFGDFRTFLSLVD